MDTSHIAEYMHTLATDVLVWVGFGTLVGLLAKAIMPGRDPGGPIATLAMGIAGTIIGCGLVMYITGGQRISPISPIGFAVGTGGAFIILFFYKLLSGYFFIEDGTRRRMFSTWRYPFRPHRTQRVIREEVDI